MKRKSIYVSIFLSTFLFLAACGKEKNEGIYSTATEEALVSASEEIDEIKETKMKTVIEVVEKTMEESFTMEIENTQAGGENIEESFEAVDPTRTSETLEEPRVSENTGTEKEPTVTEHKEEQEVINQGEQESGNQTPEENETGAEANQIESVHEHELYEYWWYYPDCVNRGYYFVRCKSCDYEETGNDENRLVPLGHQPDDGIIVKPPTCMHSGVKEHHCKVCQAALEDSIVPPDENGHVWVQDELGEYCDVCNKER